ncbi:anthranilate phosphoribosyltransferase [Streptomyces sp. b94]|uniref:anthranilate phosphoribosyltransferase n=1 Tax=Streptomyces sp. b94 TaxID=1827634 RepID=UPI001B376F5D|nr:anthranilate phosphoribosyltransferase [Streptomyces sp. b94]MBQ1101254.1 anthranilate phosphoribosyltransferase [Streptomyces sp. b94]
MLLPALRRIVAGQELTDGEARDAMVAIMNADATASEMAAFAAGLTARGATPTELAALAETAMEFARPFPGEGSVLDTCGTGGDGHDTFNISSTTAIVTAACGVRIAKHGSRSVTSRCGSADVLEELGVRVDLSPEAAAHCLETLGITFLSATVFHGAYRNAFYIMRELGVQTVFNLVGPLCNPAGAERQIIGVPQQHLLPLISETIQKLGRIHALVFWPEDGLDELSISASSHVVELREGVLQRYLLNPSDLGIRPVPMGELRGGSPEVNAALVRRVLNSEAGPRRDIVLLNTAAALRAAGVSTSWEEGMRSAAQAIDSGAARAILERWARLSQRLGEE